MIIFLFTVSIFVTFLFLGSFFNVVIDRIYRGEQFLRGRSYCESCRKDLAPSDLLPVFSYLFLKGKCRYCSSVIPFWLPIVELSTGVIFTSVIYVFFTNFLWMYDSLFDAAFGLIFILILTSLLTLIFFTDARYYVIPTIYLLAIGILILLGAVIYYSGFMGGVLSNLFFPIGDHMLGALIMIVFFGGMYLLSRGKFLGEGDIYLSGILGFFTGLQHALVMWFAAYVLGAFISILLIVLKLKTSKDLIPFGPFLIAGFAIALIFGDLILSWYLSYL